MRTMLSEALKTTILLRTAVTDGIIISLETGFPK